MGLPAHDVTVIIFATFKMCYEHFHNVKLPHHLLGKTYFWLPMSSESQAESRANFGTGPNSSPVQTSETVHILVRFQVVWRYRV